MTLHLTPPLEERLDLIAAASGRTSDDVVQEAISRYLAEVEEQTIDLQTAEDEADRDGWLTADQILDRMNERFRKVA